MLDDGRNRDHMSKVTSRMLSPPQRASISLVLRQTAVLLLICASSMAQEAPTFRADSALALVRLHVVRNNQYVTNLKPEDLVLLEDGAARNFTIFENAMTGRAM